MDNHEKQLIEQNIFIVMLYVLCILSVLIFTYIINVCFIQGIVVTPNLLFGVNIV